MRVVAPSKKQCSMIPTSRAVFTEHKPCPAQLVAHASRVTKFSGFARDACLATARLTNAKQPQELPCGCRTNLP